MKDFGHTFPKHGNSSGTSKPNPTPAPELPSKTENGTPYQKSDTPSSFPKKGTSGSKGYTDK